MWPNPQETADLITLTEEILDGKLHFLCSVGVSNNCGVWSNEVGKNRKTDEEHYDDCIKEGFQLIRKKFHKDGEGGRKAEEMGCCSINIWDGSELKTADILKTIFQHSYYLVIQIHQFLRCVMFYFKCVS